MQFLGNNNKPNLPGILINFILAKKDQWDHVLCAIKSLGR